MDEVKDFKSAAARLEEEIKVLKRERNPDSLRELVNKKLLPELESISKSIKNTIKEGLVTSPQSLGKVIELIGVEAYIIREKLPDLIGATTYIEIPLYETALYYQRHFIGKFSPLLRVAQIANLDFFLSRSYLDLASEEERAVFLYLSVVDELSSFIFSTPEDTLHTLLAPTQRRMYALYKIYKKADRIVERAISSSVSSWELERTLLDVLEDKTLTEKRLEKVGRTLREIEETNPQVYLQNLESDLKFIGGKFRYHKILKV